MKIKAQNYERLELKQWDQWEFEHLLYSTPRCKELKKDLTSRQFIMVIFDFVETLPIRF
jgi:hypothetical protein